MAIYILTGNTIFECSMETTEEREARVAVQEMEQQQLHQAEHVQQEGIEEAVEDPVEIEPDDVADGVEARADNGGM